MVRWSDLIVSEMVGMLGFVVERCDFLVVGVRGAAAVGGMGLVLGWVVIGVRVLGWLVMGEEMMGA